MKTGNFFIIGSVESSVTETVRKGIFIDANSETFKEYASLQLKLLHFEGYYLLH